LPVVSDVTNSNGTRLLSGLFVETARNARDGAHYTLKDYDYTWREKTYQSLYLLYMAEADLTEYAFANKYLADWTHWQLLTECDWFKEYLDRWRNELSLKLKAEALAKVIEESKKPGRDGLSAAKYLLEKGWEPKETGGKGRPSKQDIREAANKIATDSRLVNDHLDQLGLREIDARTGPK
jgi:hypothetical protein